MATNSSQNLGLHLWEPDDQVLRTEFNQNWQKIDTAVAAVQDDLTDGLAAAAQDLADLAADVGNGGSTARIAWGTYTGTGTFGAANPTTFACDFHPVLLVAKWENYEYGHPLVLLNGVTVMPTVFGSYHAVSVAWTSRQVSIYSTTAADVQFNMEGATYHYIILGYDNN